MNLSPSSGPPGCCCFFWPPWLAEPGREKLAPRSVICPPGFIIIAGHPVYRPVGRQHPADGLLHRSGFRAMRPLAGWKRPRPAWPRTDPFIRGGHGEVRGFYFSGAGGRLDLLLPSARPSLKPSPRLWRVLAFWFSGGPALCLSACPDTFLALRIGLGRLRPAQSWHHAFELARHLMIQFARLFVNPDFANWSGAGGQLHWIGRWDGISSLYNHLTLGLAWLCLWLTVALWFAVPARRRVIVWVFAMFVGATAALSGVYVSLISIKGLAETTIYTHDLNGGRYLLPVLLAWFTTMMTLFFADRPPAASTVAPGAAATAPPASAGTPGRSLPALKHGGWLAIGALLIVALGVFVLPKNESPCRRIRCQVQRLQIP